RRVRVERAPDGPGDEQPEDERAEEQEHPAPVSHPRSIPIRTAPATINAAPAMSLRPTSSLRRSSRTENATPHSVSVATSGETPDARAGEYAANRQTCDRRKKSPAGAKTVSVRALGSRRAYNRATAAPATSDAATATGGGTGLVPDR